MRVPPPARSAMIGEAILAAGLLLLVSACGSASTAQTTGSVSTPVSLIEGASQPTAPPTPATWQTYAVAGEGATFKYPPDWSVATQPPTTDQTGATISRVAITSPDGKFQVDFSRGNADLGGACSPPTCGIFNATTFAVPNFKTLMLIGAARDSTNVASIGFTDHPYKPGNSSTGAALAQTTYSSKTQRGYWVNFSGCIIAGSPPGCLPEPPATFYATPNEQVAEQILKSLSY